MILEPAKNSTGKGQKATPGWLADLPLGKAKKKSLGVAGAGSSGAVRGAAAAMKGSNLVSAIGANTVGGAKAAGKLRKLGLVSGSRPGGVESLEAGVAAEAVVRLGDEEQNVTTAKGEEFVAAAGEIRGAGEGGSEDEKVRLVGEVEERSLIKKEAEEEGKSALGGIDGGLEGVLVASSRIEGDELGAVTEGVPVETAGGIIFVVAEGKGLPGQAVVGAKGGVDPSELGLALG